MRFWLLEKMSTREGTSVRGTGSPRDAGQHWTRDQDEAIHSAESLRSNRQGRENLRCSKWRHSRHIHCGAHRRHNDATMATLRVVFAKVLAGVVSVPVIRVWDCGTTHMVFGVVLALLSCVFTLRRSRRECCFTSVRFRIRGAQSCL